MAYGAILGQTSSGKRVCRLVVGTSTSGWTTADCDYLCDGTADDVEINAAIQALPSTGGEIVILDGTYNITATIAMNKDNTKLSGNGAATVLKRMWDSSGIGTEGVITASDISCCIENLSIDGNNGNYDSGSNKGIYLHSCNNSIIRGNICNNNNSSGIYLYFGTNNTIVTGNICNNNTSSGINIWSINSNNNIVTGNICNNNIYGIRLDYSQGNIIIGNTCNDNDTGFRSDGSRNNVVGNTFIRGTGQSSDYTSSQYTIHLYGTGSNQNSYNLIADNNIMGKNYVSGGGTSNTFVNNKFE